MMAGADTAPTDPGFEMVKVPALEILGQELARPRAVSEICDLMGDRIERPVPGIAYDGSDQALRSVDSDGEVDLGPTHEIVAPEGRVKVREIPQRGNGRLADQREQTRQSGGYARRALGIQGRTRQ